MRTAKIGIILLVGLLLAFNTVAFGGEEETGVAANASAEVDRADRGFMASVELHCAEHDLGSCGDDLRFYHLPYAVVHYLIWG